MRLNIRSPNRLVARVMTSNQETSSNAPSPVRVERRSTAMAAAAAVAPADHSAIRPPACTGGRSIVPRPAIEPHSAWTVNSVAGRPAYGPVSPYGVIEQSTSRGSALCSATGSIPATPESTRRSAPAIKRSISGSPGAPTTECLPAARKRKSAPARSPVAPEADHCRSGSPPGGSILTTSAPASRKSLVVYAPLIPVDVSTTRRPLKGISVTRRPGRR